MNSLFALLDKFALLPSPIKFELESMLELEILMPKDFYLVNYANADMVESVIIDGRFVMEKRKVLTVDEEEILDGIRLKEKELKNRLNIPGTSPKWEFV